ncbi:ABC transporter substrate-binding protein [Thermanaerothrix sp. 4228-RoL]|jgi:multiple sugar transport system substrate-binding protein|uniref:ABC transporter substrate-binding protein n=1 Tax=Thermanaerothrix solaris TaxID=3058434 RepID=A0ABU3NRH2_9CHLR|nr:ABC transporter substrate-binding protein [Thermanaerothrix sp. 4228-RoL]MDT8899441.1 ABC transporter substrate-binding protein [Thermanaerothrix sp. 4228-RoL]
MSSLKPSLLLGNLILLFTLIVSACAPATTVTSTATPVPPTVSSSETPPSVHTSPIELTFWNYWDGKNGETIQALIDEYNTSHPEVKIKNVFIGWDELLPKLQTAVAGGNKPDIAAVDLVWMPKLAKTGAIVPLNDYIRASKVNLDDFYPSQLAVDRYDDQIFGMPVSTNNLELFYNKDLFKAAGLDPNMPPKTWDELFQIAKQCANPARGIVGMELYTEPGEGLTWQFQVYLWQSGGEFLSKDLNSAAFNSPAGEKALRFWVDLIKEGGYQISSWGLFGQGKSCMVMDGSWMVGIWAESAPFDWGTALMPYPTDGQPATNMGGEHVIIFHTDEVRQKAAWDFVNWLTSTETQVKWDMATGFMPIRDTVASSPEYLLWLEKTEPRLKPFVEGQKYAHNRPPVPNYPEISDAFSREIERALIGEVSVKDALQTAETAVNALLQK